MKGVYCLISHLDTGSDIKVGRIGNMTFEKGFYIYVGSAMNSIESRVRRHVKKDKRLFWHIDYLLERASIVDILYIETEKREECAIARKLLRKFIEIPAFGASDCKCPSHLFYSKENPVKSLEDMGLRVLP